MGSLVRYDFDGSVARITMDDGKVNVMSPAMLGALPMSLGYGSGGEARRPLGLAVVGGLIFSQLITLYLTPVVYTYMAGALNWWRERSAAPAGAPVPGLGFTD